MSTREKIQKLKDFAYDGVEPRDIHNAAPVCKKIAQKVVRDEGGDGEMIKEAFWGCMLGQLGGESVEETVEKLKRKLKREEL